MFQDVVLVNLEMSFNTAKLLSIWNLQLARKTYRYIHWTVSLARCVIKMYLTEKKKILTSDIQILKHLNTSSVTFITETLWNTGQGYLRKAVID